MEWIDDRLKKIVHMEIGRDEEGSLKKPVRDHPKVVSMHDGSFKYSRLVEVKNT